MIAEAKWYLTERIWNWNNKFFIDKEKYGLLYHAILNKYNLLPYYHNYIIYSFYFPKFKTQLVISPQNSFFSSNYFLQESQYNWITIAHNLDKNFSNNQAIDLSAYSTNGKPIIFNTVFNLLSLTYTNFFISTANLNSQEHVYKNYFFLERELKEMFGVSITNLKDTRNLLLDYTVYYNPLKKDFPVEGYKEVFLNLFDDKIEYNTTNYIEL